MNTFIKLCLVVAIAQTAVGCSDEEVAVGCKENSDCEPGFQCSAGNCLCRIEIADACGEGKYCNPFGNCQKRPPCIGNKDCLEGQICSSADPRNVRCVTGECSSSLHCPFNQYCDTTTNQCLSGCQWTADCQLGYVCSNYTCVPGGSTTNCEKCPNNPRDPTYCDYGEVCSAEGVCADHAQKAKLCSTCSGGISDCGDGLICLIDDAELNNKEYCAPTCGTDFDCPSGYEGCGGIVIVSGERCSAEDASGPCDCSPKCLETKKCDGTGTACVFDYDCPLLACPNGGKCLKSSEGTSAYCECTSNDDCSPLPGACSGGICLYPSMGAACQTDSDCLCLNGTCMGLGVSCTPGGGECGTSCQKVPATEGPIGKCVTNVKACGKGEGVTCQELKTGTADCRAM